jgi:biotin carboxyl carrier protein
MLNITVNKDKILEYKEENGKKFLNDILIEVDVQSLGNGQYHILYNGRSYRAEIVDSDKKILKIKINGKVVEIVVKDRHDLLLETMGVSTSSGPKVQEIKAPMPGLIIDIKVSEGDAVKTGDPLLVLEAMKMENIIKSPCDGVVQQILCKKGTVVEKNKLLIKFNT